MHYNTQNKALAALSLLSNVSASPLHPRTVDCNNPSTGVDASCWTTLKMVNYINGFGNNNDDCSAQPGLWQTGSADMEPFSQCLLSAAGVFDYAACSLAGTGPDAQNNCTAPADTAKKPEVYYGAYNIYAMQHYLSNWADAVMSVDSAHFSLGGIATTLKITSIDVVLKALIAKANQPQLAPANKAQNAALLAYMVAYPTKLVYAPSTDDSTNVGNMLQQRFGEILSGVETDKAKYLTMAKDGAFSVKTWQTAEGIKNLLDPQSAATGSIDPSTVDDSVAHIE